MSHLISLDVAAPAFDRHTAFWRGAIYALLDLKSKRDINIRKGADDAKANEKTSQG